MYLALKAKAKIGEAYEKYSLTEHNNQLTAGRRLSKYGVTSSISIRE